MSTQTTDWTLYVDQGNGPTKHGEKTAPKQLKAIAKQLNELAKQPSQITYLIFNPSGKLEYKSGHNTRWRMSWKRINIVEKSRSTER